MRPRDTLTFAFRSVSRQKSRNAFIITIICLTSFFSLISVGLFEGKNSQLKKNIIETETGYFQLLEENFYQRSDPTQPYTLTDDLKEKLKDFSLTPELLLKTTIIHPDGAQELTLLGIDQSHEDIFPLKKDTQGKWPPEKGDVVIGRAFARKLNLKIGDQLIITYQDSKKAILNEALIVSGIFHHFGKGLEESMAYVTRDEVMTLLNLKGRDPFHRLILMPKEKNIKPETSFHGLFLKNWQELHPELNVIMKLNDSVTRVLIIFMLVIALVSIMTPIQVLWDERESELKLLRTIGTPDRVIYLIGMQEALILGGLALVLTVIVWGLFHLITLKYGIDFSIIGEKTVIRGGILISSVVRPVLNPLLITIIFLAHALILGLGQFISLRRFLNKDVVHE